MTKEYLGVLSALVAIAAGSFVGVLIGQLLTGIR